MDSLEWVVGRFSPLLLSQAGYRLSGELRHLYDPEDLVNDVWAVALPKLIDLSRDEEALTARLAKFLGSILLYRFNNLVRKHITGKPVRQPSSGSSTGDSPLDGLARDSLGVVTRVVQQEQQRSVGTALARLDPADRELVVLRGIEQHPVKEIAIMLGLTENTVSVKYGRVLQKLRSRFEGSVFDELPET